MGMSTVIGHVVIFTFFLTTLYLLYGQFHDHVSEVSAETLSQNTRLKKQLDTELSFSTTSYSAGTLMLYIDNTGKADLDPDELDLYVDQQWVAQADVTYTIQNTTVQEHLWNPGEQLFVEASETLGGGLHEAKIVTVDGVYTSTQFDV